MNRYSKIVVYIKVLVVLFILMIFFRELFPDITNSVALEDILIPFNFILLSIAFIFSVAGCVKSYRLGSHRIQAWLILVSIPILAVVVVFSIIATFSF